MFIDILPVTLFYLVLNYLIHPLLHDLAYKPRCLARAAALRGCLAVNLLLLSHRVSLWLPRRDGVGTEVLVLVVVLLIIAPLLLQYLERDEGDGLGAGDGRDIEGRRQEVIGGVVVVVVLRGIR